MHDLRSDDCHRCGPLGRSGIACVVRGDFPRAARVTGEHERGNFVTTLAQPGIPHLPEPA